MRKVLKKFAYNSRADTTIVSLEAMSFSLKLLSSYFIGNPPLRLSEVLCIVSKCVIALLKEEKNIGISIVAYRREYENVSGG